MGVSQGESEGGQALNCCVVDISVFSVYSSSLFICFPILPCLPSLQSSPFLFSLSFLPLPSSSSPFLHPSLSSLPLPSSFPPSPPFPSFLLPSLSSLPLPLLLPFSSYPPFLLPSLSSFLPSPPSLYSLPLPSSFPCPPSLSSLPTLPPSLPLLSSSPPSFSQAGSVSGSPMGRLRGCPLAGGEGHSSREALQTALG